MAEPPPPPDLPSLIKEHLQSLPQDLKAAVEKIVEPEKPEPTLATKLKQSVGAYGNCQIENLQFRPKQML